ncbi:tail fiber domain-containing protein [Desertivirga xinjiangensis]|uniref:tail fiber domain-containing protein n=1 Tax=Desertivirga xinjiangensis TaxID=539206 RepID=UPI00210C2D84|nr:tail fiber domain-containing protein [Pedobacter xinjiangensis]
MNTVNSKLTAALSFVAVFLLANNVNAQKLDDKALMETTSPITNSVEQLSKLTPISFNYNSDSKKLKLPTCTQYGFQPSEVQQVIPGIVKSQNKMVPAGKNAFKTVTIDTVDMTSLIPFLVSSIKEQQAEIEKLKEEVRTLKSSASVAQ